MEKIKVITASDLGRMGGQSRSKKKLMASMKNLKRAMAARKRKITNRPPEQVGRRPSVSLPPIL
ncbi:MAG: hypothetical protein KGJ13_12325 [Patescibacteria group bacterium]|nr:hypothetical protein [Patescibacteria group bacterium]